MGCDHVGGPELIEMAEDHLGKTGAPQSEWDGKRFAWGENVDSTWKSVWLEIERRNGQWVVTRIDRRQESLPETETGFHDLGSV